MFVIAEDEKKGLAPTPIIWIKKNVTEVGYYWPMYGLHFKLQNYVPLPEDPNILKKEWRYVPCTILLNGETFKTCASAEKAILKILKSKKASIRDLKEVAEQVEEVELTVDDVEATEDTSKDDEMDQQQTDNVGASEEVVRDYEVETVKVDQQQDDNAAASVEIEESEVKTDENFGSFPVQNSQNFEANELLFPKTHSGLIQLEAFFLEINENSERTFFDKCVKKTFEDTYFLTDITFKKDAKRKKETDWIGVFDETKLYACMKNAVVKKLKLTGLDNTELKKIFITNFDRVKRAMRARLEE